jgi:hypothetical protein
MESVFERFGLADSLVAVAFDISDQRVDAFEDLAILRLPLQIVVPRILVPDQFHA